MVYGGCRVIEKMWRTLFLLESNAVTLHQILLGVVVRRVVNEDNDGLAKLKNTVNKYEINTRWKKQKDFLLLFCLCSL